MLGLHFTPACVLLLVCSLHFTHSLHFTPGPQSLVRSLQSAFYTDRIKNKLSLTLVLDLLYGFIALVPAKFAVLQLVK